VEVQHIYVPVRGKVLKNEFAREKPTVGSQIGLLYLGEKQGAVNKYHNYRLVGGSGYSEVDWDSSPKQSQPQLPGAIPHTGELYKPLPSEGETGKYEQSQLPIDAEVIEDDGDDGEPIPY
jgi:hypothetical protein